MRFDGNVFYHPLERYPHDTLTREWRETAKVLDQGGFTTCWLGEHHFWYAGHHVACPNPVLVGMHIIAANPRLRVGQSACVLPDHHPIRLAEDLAMLDQMSEGRLDVGIARGTNSTACIQFHPKADRRDAATNYRLFEETLDVVLGCWTEEAFSHQGEFYTFPVPGWAEKDPFVYENDPHYGPEGELIALGVTPKTYQKPHPPIWQAADSTSSYEFAARRGHAVIGVARTLEGTREAWTRYQEVASELCGRQLPLGVCANGQTLNIMRTYYVAETYEKAERQARPGINAFWEKAVGVNANWARERFAGSHETLTGEDRNMDWFDFMQKFDILWVGSPEHVVERIEKLRAEINCQHVTIWPNPPKVPYRDVLRSIGMFSERVIPAFETSAVETTPA